MNPAIALIAESAAAAESAKAARSKTPKFIYIVADGLGWKAVGFHGSDIKKTPTIDRLATTDALMAEAGKQNWIGISN